MLSISLQRSGLVWPEETSEVCIDPKSEVVGVAKWQIISLVKGSSMRKKLQNSRGYAESPELLSALGLFVFKKKSVVTT